MIFTVAGERVAKPLRESFPVERGASSYRVGSLEQHCLRQSASGFSMRRQKSALAFEFRLQSEGTTMLQIALLAGDGSLPPTLILKIKTDGDTLLEGHLAHRDPRHASQSSRTDLAYAASLMRWLSIFETSR